MKQNSFCYCSLGLRVMISSNSSNQPTKLLSLHEACSGIMMEPLENCIIIVRRGRGRRQERGRGKAGERERNIELN